MVTRSTLAALVAAALACAAPRAERPDSARAPEASRLRPLAPPPGAVAEDIDGDGKPDAWTVRSDGGRELRLYDLDGDGGPDVSLAFEGGRLVRLEVLRALESLPPSAAVFEAGRLVAPARTADPKGPPEAAPPPVQK
jgi:hypothetical protein